jgi:hypothetical protein
MTSSTIVVEVLTSGQRADELLAAIANALGHAYTKPDDAAHARFELDLPEASARESVKGALDAADAEWPRYVRILPGDGT